MPQPSHPDRERALVVIAECVQQHGPDGGAVLAHQSFQHVHPATWSRWVREALGERSLGRTRPKAASAARLPGSTVVPPSSPASSAPPPAGEAKPGTTLFADLRDLRADVAMLRAFATEDHGACVKLPTFFAAQIKAKIEIAKLAVQHAAAAYDCEQQQRFWDVVVAEVSAESPECARRITARLAQLQADLGEDAIGPG